MFVELGNSMIWGKHYTASIVSYIALLTSYWDEVRCFCLSVPLTRGSDRVLIGLTNKPLGLTLILRLKVLIVLRC